MTLSWTTGKVWLKSAECALQTSKILVVCREDKVLPIADEFGGDDLGHAITLDLASIITGKAPKPTDISIVNSTVNYLGLAALALLVFSIGLPLSSFSLLTAGTILANEFHVLTPHPAQFGVACFAAILPITILANPSYRSAWVTIGAIALVTALLFREAIGMMGAATALLAALLSTIRERSKWPTNLALVAVVIMATATPYALLRARDAAYDLPPPSKLERHGTWANLYMGLGGVDNPFGIDWNDFSAIDAVKSVDPTVDYLSPRFYDILKDVYFKILLTRPLDVAIVYYKKLQIALHTPMNIWRLQLWHILAAVSLACILVMSKLEHSSRYRAVFLVSLAFAALFLAQATLFHFDMQYLFPIKIFFLLASSAVIEALCTKVSQRAELSWI